MKLEAKTLIKVLTLLLIPIYLGGCFFGCKVPKRSPGTPTALLPQTCNKPETAVGIAPELFHNQTMIHEEIPSQAFEKIGCDGRVIETGVGPIRTLRESHTFHPPRLAAPVAFVEIHNPRTCVTKSVEPDPSGTIRIGLTDSTIAVIYRKLNVADGLNPITIKYFDQGMRLLGSAQYLVNVRVSRPHIPGVRRINACPAQNADTNFAMERH